MERWHNKVAVVTGASGSIGAACVKNLLDKGMIVVGLARRLDHMNTVLKAVLPDEQKSRFHTVQCDVRQEANIQEAFAWIAEHLGVVHVLIHCAGIFRNTHICSKNNSTDLRDTIDTNIMGVAMCTREAFKAMKEHSVDGHIVIMNSAAGHRVPQVPGIHFNVYAPSKFAMTAMTEVLRQEFLLHQTRIKITSISPGAADTGIIGNKTDMNTDLAFLSAEDIADAILYCIQTPPHVQIHEILIKPVGELCLN